MLERPDQRVVIIGAGPCGLACARELERRGHRNWLVLERADHPGGLASSVVDPQGFTWDLGGHVVFSHYGAFDELLAETMGDELLSHDRSSYIRFGDRWVPYPFQHNLRHLPEAIIAECLGGLAEARRAVPNGNFGSWMEAAFGNGITRHFMRPYNEKVWATAPERMTSDWIAERVATIDYDRARANVEHGRDDIAWGPNNSFQFPASGGTGSIYARLAARLGEGRISYRSEVVELDPAARRLRTANGIVHDYDALVSTMPLNLLVGALDECPDAIRDAARRLRHTSVVMVGVAYEAPLADEKSWMYFPHEHAPFYRATNFAKYSPAHVPGADTSRYCSYMTETAYNHSGMNGRDGLAERVEHALRAAGVVAGRPPVASIHVEDIPYAYPVPTLERDASLATIQPWLMEHSIYARGRFGSWRYEIGNMDHAVKMGGDLARALLGAGREEIWSP
jgi:protoporphyrinogen oxidase